MFNKGLGSRSAAHLWCYGADSEDVGAGGGRQLEGFAQAQAREL